MSEKTLGDVDHTHPETGKSFGETVTYRRGPAPVRTADDERETTDAAAPVTTDGGRADESDTLADVPQESAGVQSVHERGPK